MDFTKMHANGNDFVLVDMRSGARLLKQDCVNLADRRTGVGCDIIVGIGRPRHPDSVASYQLWTADGAPAAQCGNGARCVARWLYDRGATRFREFTLDSPIGRHRINIEGHREVVTVALGRPALIGTETVPPTLHEYATARGLYSGYSISIGNDHVVLETDSLQEFPVSQIGREIQDSPSTSDECNISFFRIVSRELVELRVFENGAGETLSCGTGSCATAATLMSLGRVNRNVSVKMRGGQLRVSWPDARAEISLTGPAEYSFTGRI